MSWGREVYNAQLVHRADIVRRPTTAESHDELGQPSGDYAPHLTDIPCLYDATPTRGGSGGARMGERAHDIIEDLGMLFLLAGVDVVEADRVAEVRNRAGTVILADARISLVIRPEAPDGEHHVELPVYRWRSAEAIAS